MVNFCPRYLFVVNFVYGSMVLDSFSTVGEFERVVGFVTAHERRGNRTYNRDLCVSP